MAFEPNVGQTNPKAKFLARGSEYETFLTPNAAVIVLRAPSARSAASGRSAPGRIRPQAQGVKADFLSMQLVGARPGRFSALDELPGKSNYLIGDNRANWHTNIPNYRRVREAGIYPGIDLVYYGAQRQLEYDFTVAPGADSHAIRLRIRGAKALQVDADGNLVASLAGGAVELRKPTAYQLIGRRRQPVESGYVLRHADEVTLRVGEYDRSQPLVIDPVLAYSTYLGGSGIDAANGIAVAPDDTAFVTGSTLSTNFPTVNAYQPGSGGGEDAFVSKLSSDGSTLLYSTYLGGSSDDFGNGIAVDSSGDAYVTGSTTSPDFPVYPATVPFPNCGGDGKCGKTWNTQGLIVSNGFVTKLNVTGTGIVYSTYIGVYEHVVDQAIAVDSNGIAYITGQVGETLEVNTTPAPITCPNPFPVVNGFQTGIGGSSLGSSDGCPYEFGGAATNAFVMALSSTGTSILYSTYLGGTVQDVGLGIAADANRNAYVTGLTYSSPTSDFPILNGVDTTYGGNGDAFLTKINTAGSGSASLLYSTYLGGSGLDQGNAVAVDGSGDAYVAGGTASGTLTGITPLNTYSGDGDAFVAKLNPALSGAPSLLWFRYLGGSLADSANGIAIDSSDNVYVTGSTVSSDFPTVNAFQPHYGGGNADAFVTKIAPDGASLIYSSYLGGSNTDVGNGIAVDTSGSAYVAGQTCSLDFPLASPLQAAAGGNCDAFVSKVSTQGGIVVSPAGLVFAAQNVGTVSASQTVTLTNEDSATVTFGSAAVQISGADTNDFLIQSDNCDSASLAVGASCSISVAFDPTSTGTRTAQIQVTDSASNSPQTIGLSGTASTLVLTPAAPLDFGSQVIGTTSPAQTVTVTNQGTTSVTFTSITASGPFAEADDCTKVPIPAGTNCTINVTFTPTAAGAATGALVLNDNAPGSPQEVLLSGKGIQQPSGASLQISPLSIAFPDQAIGESSPISTVTATNNGTTTVTFTSIVASGPFSETDDCTKASLQPAQTGQPYANCTINVTFTPISAGTATGTLTITDNAPGSPQIVTLSGTGVQSSSSNSLLISPTSLTFPSQAVGATSTPLTVTATNQGAADLTISSISASGAFAETDNCVKAPLPPGTNCTISVTFSPLSIGSNVGALTITTSAGGQQLVLLTGTGTASTSGSGGTGGQTADFTISSQPSSATVNAGTPAQFALTVSAVNGFSQQVSLACAGLPSGAFCDISPNPVTPGTNVTLKINTTSRSLLPPASGEPWRPFGSPDTMFLFAGVGLALLLFVLVAGSRQPEFRARRPLAALALAITLALFSVACGGGTRTGQTLGTPAGTYQVTVTGTSGTLSNSTTLSLNVN
jgi:hypothetical protein